MKRALGLSAVLVGLPWAAMAAADLAVNSESMTSDLEPSLSKSPNETVWVAWHACGGDGDRILARRGAGLSIRRARC